MEKTKWERLVGDEAIVIERKISLEQINTRKSLEARNTPQMLIVYKRQKL